jgi:hypothetical protein
MWLAVFVVAALGAGWAAYQLWETPVRFTSCTPVLSDLEVALTYRTFLASGDEGYADLTVRNRSLWPITATVVLAFAGSNLPQVAPEGKSGFELKELPGQAQETRRVKFALRQSVWPWQWDRYLLFMALVRSERGVAIYPLPTQWIYVVPIPHLGRILNWLVGSSLMGAAARYLWGWLKELLSST